MRSPAPSTRRRDGPQPVDAIALAVLIALFARTFVLQGVAIPTRSMVPSLLPGDHVLVDKLGPALRAAGPLAALLPLRRMRRGDIVAVRAPTSPPTLLVKRLVALPGETVEIADGRVRIDGVALDESGYADLAHGAGPDQPPLLVGEDALYLLGDARGASLDSRDLGPVPAAAMVGRVVMIYWSWGDPPGGSVPGTPARRTRWTRVLRRVR